jgi:DNA-binding NarL/FixJ family response regulator
MDAAAPPAATKRTILLVEDHLLFRAMLARLINSQSGLTVCGEVDNVRDALRSIEATRPDAAIVDLTLKDSNGLDLIEDLRARKLLLPVLVLSMHAGRCYQDRAIRAGAQGYVSKQGSPTEVVAALRTVLAGGIYARQE